MRTVLFVCTGNTCRSPMAEGIARSQMPDDKFFIASAGVSAVDGMPISHQSLEALTKLGIELEGRSKMLTEEMIRGAELVLCMTDSHRKAAQELVGNDPELIQRILRLDPAGDIPDPIGQGQDRYDEVARHLQEIIPVRLAALAPAS